MGANGSKTPSEQSLQEHLKQSTERYFGLENFGNTCYANSVLQALYFCVPFRIRVLEYYERKTRIPVLSANVAAAQEATTAQPAQTPIPRSQWPNHLLMTLAELFVAIYTNKKKIGTLAPRKFIEHLRRENELFRTDMQQDSQEFLIFLFDHFNDILKREESQSQSQSSAFAQSPAAAASSSSRRSFIDEIFQGSRLSECRCNECENVTFTAEHFRDLALDVQQNTSITYGLRMLTQVEYMRGTEKFFCECCNTLQEARKRVTLSSPLPRVLILHLKRFKYSPELQMLKKLPSRVSFPFELRVSGLAHKINGNGSAKPAGDSTGMDTSTDDAIASESAAEESSAPMEIEYRYELFAVVVHVGSGMNSGHYKTMIKSDGQWLLFDDSIVEPIPERSVQSVFGYCNEAYAGLSSTGYLLFYS